MNEFLSMLKSIQKEVEKFKTPLTEKADDARRIKRGEEGDLQHRAAAATAGDALPARRIRSRAACDGGSLAGSDHLDRQAGGGGSQDADGAAPATGMQPTPRARRAHHATPAHLLS